MEIMVTVPADPAEREALFQRAARLHAEAICAVLAGLTCPAEQKTALLRTISEAKEGKTNTKKPDL